jgi:hypothetical protein
VYLSLKHNSHTQWELVAGTLSPSLPLSLLSELPHATPTVYPV